MPKEEMEKSWAEKQAEAAKALKEAGFRLGGIDLPGMGIDGKGMRANEQPLSPNTFTEHSGRIRFATEDGANFLIPATEKVRKLLQAGNFKQAEGLVPNLDELSVWQGDSKGPVNSAYYEWQRIARDAAPEMMAEAEALRISQDRARDVFEAGSQAEADEPTKQQRADQLAADIKAGNIG